MRCEKCQGCLRVDNEAVACLNCGLRVYRPDPPESLCMDPARWQSVLCHCQQPAAYGRDRCQACITKSQRTQGYAKKQAGTDRADRGVTK
jgi:hypothetical protein